MAGKVWLAGAGPGDAGLLTLKAKKVLESAETVVYDSLVGKAILAMIPKEAQRVYVGKRAGRHTMTQEQINELLIKMARRGKRVVRLKGGDPFLFGRGGEEGEALMREGIPFEVIPGVTAAFAVPAYAGIPVTHRSMASMVHVITGHKKGDEPLHIDFSALVKAGGTYVFLMGLSSLPQICQGPMEGGLPGSTPAAVISRGTTAMEKGILATVSTLTDKAAESSLDAPAVIVAGDVCACMETLNWRQFLPLSGRRYVVTRPRERAFSLSESLRELGAEVIEIPAVKTVFCKDNIQLKEAIDNIHRYDILAFTSPAGAEYFFDYLREIQKDIRCLGQIKLAAMGAGTAKALEKRGLMADYVPETYNSVFLGKLLCEVAPKQGFILLPRAREGSRELTEELSKRKDITLTEIPLYDTVFETNSVISVWEEIKNGEIREGVFTSASTVKGFVGAAGTEDVTKITAYCIGEKTAAEAKKAGMKCVIAKEATVDALVQAILDNRF